MSHAIEQQELMSLVSFRMEKIKEEIEAILKKWNYSNTDDFIDDTKSGSFDAGVMDAIALRQLLHDHLLQNLSLRMLYQYILDRIPKGQSRLFYPQ